MPRHNAVRRTGDKVVVVIDSVQHTLTVSAFIELMTQAVGVMQSLERTHGG